MSDQWRRNDHEERRDRGVKSGSRKKKGLYISPDLIAFHPSILSSIHPSIQVHFKSISSCPVSSITLPLSPAFSHSSNGLFDDVRTVSSPLPGVAILEQLMDSWDAAVTTLYCLYNTIGCSRAEAHHSLRWKEKRCGRILIMQHIILLNLIDNHNFIFLHHWPVLGKTNHT